MELELAERAVRGTADLLAAGEDANWSASERPARISIAKIAATEAAVRVSDIAMRLTGGGSDPARWTAGARVPRRARRHLPPTFRRCRLRIAWEIATRRTWLRSLSGTGT